MEIVVNYIIKQKIGEYKENVSFKKLTTYKVGGDARLVVFPENVEKLLVLLKYLKKRKISYYILGNGSNILASDNNYDGVIIKLTKIDYIKKLTNRIVVGAGCNLIKLATEMCREGKSGFEFACGIPGTIGGAIYMNAGAYNSSISNIFIEAKFINDSLEIITIKRSEMDFAYRHSLLQNNKHLICVEATFAYKKGNVSQILNLVEGRKLRRKESQPLSYPSAGSVFRNPYMLYAGALIESVGLKGKTAGGAKISEKHANFIVNNKNAKSADIKKLMDLAKIEVYKKFGVELKIEQELLNWE